MRQALTVEPGRMVVEEVDPPDCAPDQAVVAVEAVGLCGSDFHLFAGDHPYATFPQRQGHEFAGRVARLGADYAGPLRVGERVAVEPLLACGHCFACRRGRYNCCRELKVIGAHVPGGLAEQVAVPAAALHPAGSLSPALAALVEPVSIGYQAVRRGEIVGGDRVVVLGAGPIGLTAMLAATDLGADVLVVDRIARRLVTASELGATAVVDTARCDLAEAVRTWTDADGPAVVIDATGVPALITAAIDMVAPSGVVVVVGISDDAVSIPVIEFSRKEVSIHGSRNNAGVFAESTALVRRHAERIGALITHTYPLEQAAEAMEFARANPHLAEKVVVTVGDDSAERS